MKRGPAMRYFGWVEVGKDLLAMGVLLVGAMVLCTVIFWMVMRWVGVAL